VIGPLNPRLSVQVLELLLANANRGELLPSLVVVQNGDQPVFSSVATHPRNNRRRWGRALDDGCGAKRISQTVDLASENRDTVGISDLDLVFVQGISAIGHQDTPRNTHMSLQSNQFEQVGRSAVTRLRLDQNRFLIAAGDSVSQRVKLGHLERRVTRTTPDEVARC
jgi:hypothetical protein